MTLAGLLIPSCVEGSFKTNMVHGEMFKVIEAKYDPRWDVKSENLYKEAVSHMGGIVHCDAGSDGQQHLIHVEDFNAIQKLEDNEDISPQRTDRW